MASLPYRRRRVTCNEYADSLSPQRYYLINNKLEVMNIKGKLTRALCVIASMAFFPVLTTAAETSLMEELFDPTQTEDPALTESEILAPMESMRSTESLESNVSSTANCIMTALQAADDPNSSADSIIGNYLVEFKGEKSKVKISKGADGTYTAQIYWVENRLEKDGTVRKDSKNPNKSLRNVDCDKIVIFKGLKYDSTAKVWSGANIYDPVRGINASLKAWFKDSKTLALKGSKMGFSETVTWTRM